MDMILGMQAVASPLLQPVPKLQLSPSFTDCSEEMREEMNKYLLETFGTYTPCYIFGKTLVLSPKHLAALRNLEEVRTPETTNSYESNAAEGRYPLNTEGEE